MDVYIRVFDSNKFGEYRMKMTHPVEEKKLRIGEKINWTRKIQNEKAAEFDKKVSSGDHSQFQFHQTQ